MVTTIFMLLIDASKEAPHKMRYLDQVFYVFYLILFPKNTGKIKIITLIHFEGIINIKNATYAAKLSFKINKINISV